MHRFVTAIAITIVLGVWGTLGATMPPGVGTSMIHAAGDANGDDYGVGRVTLPPNDGWAAFSTGTAGGSAATPNHVYAVTDREQLVAALRDGDVPKIISIQGTIEGNVNDDNQPLSCDDYAMSGYTRDSYLAAYNPTVWGMKDKPSGPLEDARAASQKQQGARVQIRIGSNTTIIGLGDDARIHGANFVLAQVDNVIVRNLRFDNAQDCFPQWDPTDGANGNWNSQYDNISLLGASHVWIDHCAFSDGEYPDAQEPTYFGRPFQVHDGEVDITNGSDLVTVSWNRFTDHDKTMLIGSTDSPRYDVGKLRVTLHHNLFANTLQRSPRVRYGEVHAYNNYYDISDAGSYQYSWGVGVESKLYAEHNAMHTIADIPPAQFIHVYGGTAIHEADTLVNGQVVAVRGAYNTANGANLSDDVGWTPTLHAMIDPVEAVPALVTQGAGPLRINPTTAP